ncbi:hypothetical protein GS531_19190 [Rhodococcus hoagii]|nr:hypothetical protein [Prescottella equi]
MSGEVRQRVAVAVAVERRAGLALGGSAVAARDRQRGVVVDQIVERSHRMLLWITV